MTWSFKKFFFLFYSNGHWEIQHTPLVASKFFLSHSYLLSAVSFQSYGLLWATACTNSETNLPQKLALISIIFSLGADFEKI